MRKGVSWRFGTLLFIPLLFNDSDGISRAQACHFLGWFVGFGGVLGLIGAVWWGLPALYGALYRHLGISLVPSMSQAGPGTNNLWLLRPAC